MKYNFWGYDVQVMLQLGLDFNDLAFIQWYRDFKDSGEMESIETPDGTAYYTSYEKIASDLPVMFKRPTGTESDKDLTKINNANRMKINRMLKDGALSKMFKRYEKKVDGKTKIYLLLNNELFTSLINNGKKFDGSKINMDSKVIKLNDKVKPNKAKKGMKKAPSTDGTVKDAQPNKHKSKHDSNTISDNLDNVKPKSENNEINIDDLNINAIAIHESGIKIFNVDAVNKEVENWSGLVLAEAIQKTLTSANTPNFNYLRNTYNSMIENGIESAEENLIFKPSFNI